MEIEGLPSESEGWSRSLIGRHDRGKLTDSQDHFFFCYRKIDPRRENFSLEATIEVTDASGADFQTGYGIMVADTVASGSKMSCHRNLLLLGCFRAMDGRNYARGLRTVGGYSDPDAIRHDGRRRLDPSRLFQTQPLRDEILAGDRMRLRLEKTDGGFKASLLGEAGPENIFFHGCDFLMKQDRKAIYIGFALGGELEMKISDVVFKTFQGKASRTPRGEIRHLVPDYPFSRNALVEPPVVLKKDRLRNTVIMVSPSGEPFGLAYAIAHAGPGCEIVLSDGVYDDGPYYVPNASSGNVWHPVTLRSEHSGMAVIQGTGRGGKLPGMILRTNHWVLDGLVFAGAPSSGLFICGSHNVIINCEAFGNGDSGILMCAFPGVRRRDWPSKNRLESCCSHDNCDLVRRNADGFGVKLSVGRGNSLVRCVASHNVDDGFDLYTKSVIGPIAPVTLVECEAIGNGWLSSESRPAESKTGSGFKLGGEGQQVRHRLIGCVAEDNAAKGFHPNSNNACVLSGCRG